MIKKIIHLSIAILFMTTTFFSPCSSAGNKERQQLTVILDWLPNPNHGPLVIAKELGYFKEAGLDVTLIGPVDPSDPPKWVAAKKADIGITYEPQFMQYVDRHLPLIRIGTLIDKPLNCLVVLKESGITELSQLKHKLIGSSMSNMSGVLLGKLLEEAKLKKTDVTLVQVKYNLNQALLSKRVDAVSGMMRNVEVPQLEALHHDVIAFFPEEHGIPTYSELIYISHLDRKNDPAFKRFIAATEKATRYIIHHPKEAWQLFTKAYPEAKASINEKIWFYTVPYFDDTPGDFNSKEWETFSNFLLDHQLIKTKQPISRYAIQL